MIVTDNKEIYERLLMLRDYGRISRYEHKIIGYNSRLDTLQAAILRLKLKKLDRWNESRRDNAHTYTKQLRNIVEIVTPQETDYGKHVYHIYAIRIRNRNRIHDHLRQNGIGVLIHYPIPLHLQPVYEKLGYRRGDFPVAEKIASEVLSIPMFPHLKEKDIKYISNVLKDIYAR
jgi:dTDP-4-amino-4,6-dideoxygalactose transaminase